MEDEFFYTITNGHRIYSHVRLAAACAAAGIHINGVTRGQWYNEKDHHYVDRYIVQYEWQWRSRGNYIWSKSVYMGENDFDDCLYNIYQLVRKMRDKLEDPAVRGKYRYLEEE